MINHSSHIELKQLNLNEIKCKYPFCIQKLDINEYYENKREEKKGFLLDIYPNSLSQNDPRVKLLDERDFLFANEYKFLNFFKEIFLLNEHSYILDFAMSDLKEKLFTRDLVEVLNTWEILDYSDKNIFLQLLLELDKKKYSYYESDNFWLYQMISKLIYRNDFSMPDIVFLKYPLRIFYTYGVCVLLTIENKNDFVKYEKIATKNELFLR